MHNRDCLLPSIDESVRLLELGIKDPELRLAQISFVAIVAFGASKVVETTGEAEMASAIEDVSMTMDSECE